MEHRQGPQDVRIVSLPFTSLQYPSLGASLLATGLRAQGLGCAVDYLAFEYAEAIGLDDYLLLSHEKFYQAFLGEWIFSPLVFPRAESLDIAYLTDVLPEFADPIEAVFITQLALRARKAAAAFIDDAARKIAAQNPKIVGVTTSFQQNLASIAFARALKKRAPQTLIIFGGANCEAELGQHLLESFAEIDAVCSGEGDAAFPAFVQAVLEGNSAPDVPGIRTRAGTRSPRPAAMVTAMDDLPVPDFDDFYARFHQVPGLDALVQPAPMIETSRGCWWGAKHHCTFCGLNGNAMAYRSKSPARAFAEFRTQGAKYGSDFVVVDNILDYTYFDSLLPLLRDDPLPYLMHYEVKSNLYPKHIKAMAEAGVRKIQPGIETLDSDILRLMKKGVTALQNIQTLKLCAQAGIFVDWGFIYGFPGELAGQYDAMAALIPLLHHLQPPAAFAPVRADRFSPYFNDPEGHGVTLSPSDPYRFIYAGVGDDLGKFSYHHQMSGPGIDEARDYTKNAGAAVRHWQACHKDTAFYILEDAGDTITLVDARGQGPERRITLDALQSRIVAACTTITSRDRVRDALAVAFDNDRIEAAVTGLIADGVLLQERNSLLALPLMAGGFTKAPTWAEIRNAVLHDSHAARDPLSV